MAHGQLVQMCIDAASKNKESVRSWRNQVRTLERMPNHLAEPLVQQLLANHLLTASLLEPFRYSIQELNLSGEPFVDAEWMAYLRSFKHLRVLNVSDCKSLTSAAISALSGVLTLEDLQMDRCKRITGDGIRHISTLTQLKRLGLSETGLRQGSFSKLSDLTNLTHLNLGGLPVTDGDIWAFQSLQNLVHLNLWGSKVTNDGASTLTSFPKLTELNVSWTNVTMVPTIPTLSYLEISNCTIISIFEGFSATGPGQLLLSGSSIEDPVRWLPSPWLTSVTILDLSQSVLDFYGFLPCLTSIVKLDLSLTAITDASVALLADCGANLKWLNLALTKVGTTGVAALSRSLPVLEFISLKGTMVDDEVLSYLGTMTALSSINLARTHIKGISVSHLEQLPRLRQLDLRNIPMTDRNCKRVARLSKLTHLLLRSPFFSNKSFHAISAMPELEFLAFQCTVLTDTGLSDFRPPPRLVKLDISGSWLLSHSCISQFSAAFPHVQLIHGTQTPPPEPRSGNRSTPPRVASPVVIKDERIRYDKEELLNIGVSCKPDLIPHLIEFPELL